MPDDLSHGQCNYVVQPKLYNCGDNHMLESKLTYKEAINRVNQRGGNYVRSRTAKQSNTEMVSSDGKVLVDLKKLVTFITG